MKEFLAIVASIFAILGNLSYCRDVFQKKIIPHPYTWLVWTVVSGVTFFGQMAKGAGVGALPTGVAEFFTLVIFIFSLQYGFAHVDRKDTYFLVFALIGIILWVLTKDPTAAVVIVVTIDLIAFIPTLRKTWQHPETEKSPLYLTNVVRHVLTLFSLQAYNIATTLHSIAMIAMNSLMSGIILQKKISSLSMHEHREIR